MRARGETTPGAVICLTPTASEADYAAQRTEGNAVRRA
jgi:hypothetical protein